MPIPISKVSDDMVHSQLESFDFEQILPLLQMQPFILLQEAKPDKKEIEAIKDVWLKATDLGDNTMKVSSDISVGNISYLKSKGHLKGEGDTYSLTLTGKKLLKDFILNDEESTFCKQASKELVSKNSYDFGEEVLVKVNDPEKFGARYISIPKKAFSKEHLKPQKIRSYNIATKDKNGNFKKITDYTDEELVHVLHLAKSIVKNASKIALESSCSVPTNRIKAFADRIMTQLNREKPKEAQTTIADYVDIYNQAMDNKMELKKGNSGDYQLTIDGKVVKEGSLLEIGLKVTQINRDSGLPHLWSE